jgi:hypothetical protein
VRKANNLAAPSLSRFSRQCGILNISHTCRPPWAVTGMALLVYIYICIMFVPHRRRTYGPPRPATGIALLLLIYIYIYIYIYIFVYGFILM